MLQSAVLSCHPSTPTDAIRQLVARAGRAEDRTLVLRWSLEGDLSRIAIPPPTLPRIATRLWEHTCFEAFIDDGGEPYHELNLAPSGEWQAHVFARYRDGGPLDDETLAPAIAVRRHADRLEFDAVVPLASLALAYARGAVRIGLTAVIEEMDGRLSYWALRHPAGKPDFHHADGRVLRLEPPAGAC